MFLTSIVNTSPARHLTNLLANAMVTNHKLHIKAHPVRAMQDNFHEIECNMAIWWSGGSYRVYVAVMGSMSRSSLRKITFSGSYWIDLT